jgi:preprotein translocase subunit YajC
MTAFHLLTSGNSTASSSPFTMILLMVAMFAIIRPQKKQQKKEQEMRDSLQVGDEITTIGGIMGRVVTVKEDSLIIETGADRNKMRIARWAVQTNNTANEKLAAEREAAQAKAQEERAKRSAEEGGKKRRGRKKDLDEVSTAKAEETAQAKKDEE